MTSTTRNPKCPECNSEVEYLKCEEDATIISYFDGRNFERSDEIQTGEIAFRCPSCGALLFTSHSDAEDFMDGEAGPPL